ncbi:MFS transporter [Anoxybacteroides rupiense]|uniref:MFS transporter n=1 Tax=Anoxybacteroides rupiense TaxID=311460 RepID=UPI00366D86B8
MKIERHFLVLMLGQSLANIGDVLYIVGVMTTIYRMTGSAAAASFIPLTITLAMFISSALLPLFIGVSSLTNLLAGSQIGKTAVLLGLGAVVAKYADADHVYVIFAMISVIAFLDGCANPLRQALIPHYVEEERLIQANGMAETVTQLIQIGAWFFGSLLLAVFQPSGLIWLAAALFTLASLLFCLLKKVKQHERERGSRWQQLTQGWQTIAAIPALKAIAVMECLETVSSSVWIAAILMVYVKEMLNVQEIWWGYLNSASLIGLMIGSLLCVKFPLWVDRRRAALMAWSSLVSGMATIGVGMTRIPVLALILSAVIGCFSQLKQISQQTLIQTNVPKEQLAAVYTSIGTISTAIFGISSLIMGWLSDTFGASIVFVFSGLLLLPVSVIAYAKSALWRKTQRQDGRRGDMEKE